MDFTVSSPWKCGVASPRHFQRIGPQADSFWTGVERPSPLRGALKMGGCSEWQHLTAENFGNLVHHGQYFPNLICVVLLKSNRHLAASIIGISNVLKINGNLAAVACSNLVLCARDFTKPNVCNTLRNYHRIHSNFSKQQCVVAGFSIGGICPHHICAKHSETSRQFVACVLAYNFGKNTNSFQQALSILPCSNLVMK